MSYQDSLRQQAQWVREALDPAVDPSQRITIDDVDFDELEAAADHIDVLVKALEKIRSYNVDIAAGRINYRPHDHIQVVDEALNAAVGAPTREKTDGGI